MTDEHISENQEEGVVVYRDSRYQSSWIDMDAGYPEKIANYLEYEKVDADQLKDFMVGKIKSGAASQSVVVFSQDVVPETIAERCSSNITFREYLDAGGSVVWLGDVPFFKIGRKEKEPDKAWKNMAPVQILGVVPIFTIPKQSVSFTDRAERFDLDMKWSGTRPVMNDSGIQPLAKTENLTSTPFIDIQAKKRWYSPLTSRLRRLQRVDVSIPGNINLGFGLDLSSEEKEQRITAHETHVNAWFKNYNDNFSNTGFLRIWDYEMANLTEPMLEELSKIVEKFYRIRLLQVRD